MTSINPNSPLNAVSVAPTASRVTPQPAPPFKDVLGASASVVLEGAQAAVQVLPGGPVLAAAVRGGANAASASAGSASSTATGAIGSTGYEGVMSQQTQETMALLQMQQDIQDETRKYTLESNISKTRHDTMKYAIGNMR